MKALPLPDFITSRTIRDVHGLDMHILEAGVPTLQLSDNVVSGPLPEKTLQPYSGERPLLLLLHGFPELYFIAQFPAAHTLIAVIVRAYSFRKVIEPLASSGYHVVAPDQRGYGRTAGWDVSNGASFGLLNLVADIVALVLALGHRTVACVVGHDFGSLVAGYCALVRPDMFRSVILMSAPFPGPPSFSPTQVPSPSVVAAELAALDPPRKHYQHYYASPISQANEHMLHAPQGLSAFLRAYYHIKSADWSLNDPRPLPSWSGAILAEMPPYYIMKADETMAEAVASHDPGTESSWLSNTDLEVYTSEFARTTFQGGLNWYQFGLSGELRVFSQKRITVPSLFIAGEKDWGMYQAPGGIARMLEVCERMGSEGCCVVKGAGHWVQQERPEDVVRLVTQFLAKTRVSDDTI